jgi:hypothetical protein
VHLARRRPESIYNPGNGLPSDIDVIGVARASTA